MITNKDIKFFLKEFNLDLDDNKYKINLNDILGTTLYKGVKMDKIDNTTLYLKAKSSGYKAKFDMKKTSILKQINKYYPQLGVKDIICCIVRSENF